MFLFILNTILVLARYDDDNEPVWPQWLWATSLGYETYSHQPDHHSCGEDDDDNKPVWPLGLGRPIYIEDFWQSTSPIVLFPFAWYYAHFA
jgi:hypothetical protein